jgi:hypothetical protein
MGALRSCWQLSSYAQTWSQCWQMQGLTSAVHACLQVASRCWSGQQMSRHVHPAVVSLQRCKQQRLGQLLQSRMQGRPRPPLPSTPHPQLPVQQ